MALLQLNNVSVRAGGAWALWDVDFELDPGEIVAVFGRSGSGKSMLGRVIAGRQQPTSGAISFGEGDSAAPVQVSQALSRPACAAELTVYENLDMFAALWSVPRRKRTSRISFVMELLGLVDYRAVRASRLSAGILARLEIARSLLADTPLLIIDSLLDTLDRDIFETMWDHLLAIRRQMRSVLILTSSGKVAETCSRVAVIHCGRLSFVGRPDDFRRLAGDDVVVLGGIANPLLKSKVQEQFSVVVKEEDGFLSFRVGNGERMVADLLSEFGGELSCVYLKRPTLEDALDVMACGGAGMATAAGEGESD